LGRCSRRRAVRAASGVTAVSVVRSFRRGSQDRAHDEAGPEVLKPAPGRWPGQARLGLEHGEPARRGTGDGRSPITSSRPGSCRAPAPLPARSWASIGRLAGARYPGQLVLAGSPGRSVSWSPCRCWGMPGSARRRTGPCCGACRSSRIRWRGGLSAACAPALSGVSALYCERNEAEEVSRPAMAIHPPASSPKLAVLVPAAATWSGPRRCARFR
jgi:hypothetical protein